MLLTPLRNNISRSAVSEVKFVPGPFGGWNARDPVFAMKPQDAIRLDNWIPVPGGVQLREGFAEWTDGLVDPVESLLEYAPPSGDNELFAAAGGKLFDITTQGDRDPGTDSVVDSLTNDRWQSTMFSNLSGNRLIACNGADAVLNYDGSSWTTPTINNVTSANLINVCAHQSRLWFVEKDSLSIWYLDTNAISGDATEIDFAPACKLGGKLIAMGSWTRDGGAGVDDMAVFVTSKGEVLLYSGSDPSSAETWARVGIFRISEPIGYRCFIKAGADLAILTSQGLLPLSGVLPMAQSAQQSGTDKISGAFEAAYKASGRNFGWQVLEYPKKQLVIVNVPVSENADQVQYVLNTKTKGWCRFLGLEANCWALNGDQLFFGTNDGRVCRYGEGVSDDETEPIEAIAISAFNTFGSARSKTFKRIRPQIFGPASYKPRTALQLDYDDSDVDYTIEDVAAQGGAIWDVAEWDVAEWAPPTTAMFRWQGVSGVGVSAAVVIAVRSALPMSYNGALLMYEPGGMT